MMFFLCEPKMDDFHMIALHHLVAYIMGYAVWIPATHTCIKYVHPFRGKKFNDKVARYNNSDQFSIILLDGIIADLL